MKRIYHILIFIFIIGSVFFVTVYILSESRVLDEVSFGCEEKVCPKLECPMQKVIEKEGGVKEAAPQKLSLGDILGESLPINEPIWHAIYGTSRYSLKCNSQYYKDLIIGGGESSLVPQSSVKVSVGTENFVLYVDGTNAKMFGADFSVLSDDSSHMVATRHYQFSGLTETLTLNKDSGLLIDSKTFGSGLGNQPYTATYLFACEEI